VSSVPSFGAEAGGMLMFGLLVHPEAATKPCVLMMSLGCPPNVGEPHT